MGFWFLFCGFGCCWLLFVVVCCFWLLFGVFCCFSGLRAVFCFVLFCSGGCLPFWRGLSVVLVCLQVWFGGGVRFGCNFGKGLSTINAQLLV